MISQFSRKKTQDHILMNDKQDYCASSRFAIGTRYQNATLSRWIADEGDKRKVMGWLQKPKNILCLLGNPGTGKTFFCAAAANWLLEKGQEVYYMNIRRFFEALQKAIGAGKNQYEEINKVSQKAILILDDLGASRNNDWQKEVILDLIDQRYSNEMPTIITSNLSFGEMSSVFDDRIERRIHNNDNVIIIQHSDIRTEAGA